MNLYYSPTEVKDMFTSDQQWQDRQQEIAAYQHHQEQMKAEIESRTYSEVDNR